MEKGTRIEVLGKGYVQLIDWMGSDESIVEAARISTGRGFVSWDPYRRCKTCGRVSSLDRVNLACFEKCEGTAFENFPRGDLGILDYLYRMEHTSPFEMAELVIDVKCPMDVWRQWIRNRTASVNEYSTRYSEAIDDVAETAPDAWRTQGKTNRQGSGEMVTEWPPGLSEGLSWNGEEYERPGDYLSAREADLHQHARLVYEERLAFGVAKEQARKDLPLSNYTAARWKIDLHNLLKAFLKKRLHPHAQIEIRAYAQAVAQIVKAIWPRTYSLFEEYDLYSERLSKTEVEALRGVFGYMQSEKMTGSFSNEQAALMARIGSR